MLDHAIAAVQRGQHIFPGEVGGKRPHRAIGDWGPLPTDDIGQLCAWWGPGGLTPGANVAVACKPSGLLVIDCDPPKKEGDRDGLEEYTAIWAELGLSPAALYDTYVVETGRGGLHFYYAWPPSLLAKGARLVDGDGTRAANVDIRCNNGERGNYVLGAGSVTEAGEYRVANDRSPARCPGPLGHRIANPPAPPRPVADARTPGPAADDPLMAGGGGTTGILAWLAEQQPGGQDMALTWVVRALRDDGLPREETARLLWDVISTWPCDREPWTERDVERHVRSAYK